MRDFVVASPDEIRALDKLAYQLRNSSRARARACGLPIVDAFSLVMMEQAGKVGSR